MKSIIITLSLLISTLASADCLTMGGMSYCGPGQCQYNVIGMVECSAYAGGGAAKDVFKSVVCGKGKCAKDSLGLIQCSVKVGGNVRKNGGVLTCDGGCAIASNNNCVDGEL